MIALVKLSVHCFGFLFWCLPVLSELPYLKYIIGYIKVYSWCPFLKIGSIITVRFGAVVRLSAVLSQDNTGGAEQLTQLSIKF